MPSPSPAVLPRPPVTIDRSGTFAGSVTLGVTGEPSSVDAVFAPASLGAGESTAAITVSAAGSAVPFTYPLTLTASGTGVSTDDATLTVVITALQVSAQ